MPQEKQSVTCESCGKAFKLTGYSPHCKSCIKQACREREDNAYLGILRQGVDVDANNIDNILVKHHPSTTRPSEKGHQPRAYKPDVSTDPCKEQINHFLKLIKSACCRHDSFTPNEYTDLHSMWRAASHCMTAVRHSSNSHLFKFNSSTFVHFIDEPWTADKFWNLQKGYPVVAQLANLPIWIQNGEGIRGGHVVGWLLISFKKILGTIEKESETGCWVKCWDGLACCFFPVVLILSADYEEQAVMALVHGIKSNFPCPMGLVPRNNISKFPAQCEIHTSAKVIKTTEKREQILMQQGLRDIDNAFFIVANTDVYCALSWDWLHANFVGKLGDHLWPELLRILDKGGHQVAARVEKNFSMMPHWHSLNHFDDALSISYTDGQKFEDLSKLVAFACHDILSPVEKEGYLLLHCLHAYIEFDLYTALELHMVHTLVAGQEALATFNVLMQRFSEKTENVKKNWNFPKNHMHMHVFDDIKAKGVTWNFSTKPNEKMHGPLKEKYQRCTNFQNVAEQILQVNHLELVSELIHCTITNYDTNTRSPDDNDADEVKQEDFFHVRLGSRVKHPLMLEAVKQRSITNKVFFQFQMKLNEFLNRYFTAVGKTLPGGKCIQFQPNDQIMEFKYIKVNFESVVDWCQYMDHLQCNPNFHGCSHYDCILLKTQQQDIFGQLIFMFQCVVSEESFPLALMQPYDALTQPQLVKDVHLNLWRVSEFFLVHSIIHGVLLYPDHT
ncbi:hypothetical protein EV401DRAFT_2062414 [Pisolithus croceorrhizus]|nr:hypothetical protein EV401DRAFT_2062414 [Pisolithus croceorrhizus]